MPVNPETGKIPHGTNGGYTNWGCRCDKCKRAHADDKKNYLARTRYRYIQSKEPEQIDNHHNDCYNHDSRLEYIRHRDVGHD